MCKLFGGVIYAYLLKHILFECALCVSVVGSKFFLHIFQLFAPLCVIVKICVIVIYLYDYMWFVCVSGVSGGIGRGACEYL